MDLPRSRPLVAEKVRRARVWIVEFRVAYRTIVLFREHCESDNPLLEDHQAFVRRTRLLGNPREAPMQSSVEPCGTRQVHDCQSQLPPRMCSTECVREEQLLESPRGEIIVPRGAQ
jgi:hypothetical protein